MKVVAQTFTAEQQTQARTNIAAASDDDLQGVLQAFKDFNQQNQIQ